MLQSQGKAKDANKQGGLLAARLHYAAMGLHTFLIPPGTRASYKSAKNDPQGRRWGATNDPHEIKQECAQCPDADAGVGIATGLPSGIFVTDHESLTSHHKKDGLGERAKLETKYGKLPVTLQVETPTGGLHEYWRYPSNGTAIKTSTGKLAVGIDVLSTGSMVIAPPTIRQGKGVYRWLNEGQPIVEAPDWLVKLIVEAGGHGGNVEDRVIEDRPQPATPELVADLVALIPNNAYVGIPNIDNFEFGWDDWNAMLMRIWRVTNGSPEGLAIADSWSQKNADKYTAKGARDRWRHWARNPHTQPTRAGFGTIHWFALRADPDRYFAVLDRHAAADNAKLDAAAREAHDELHGKAQQQKARQQGQKKAKQQKAKQRKAKQQKEAKEAKQQQQQDAGVGLKDFHAYMPMHNYIFAPTREHWPATSVNGRIRAIPLLKADGTPSLDKNGEQRKLKANTWLDKHRPVEQMTWAPGLPMLIPNRLVSDGGWINRQDVTCFNLYRPPALELGDAAKAGPWLDHAHKVYSDDDAVHIIKWLAHRVQCPQIKPNHAIVVGSKRQGTGKDTLLEPVKHAIGPWNFHEVSAQQVLGRFNGFLKSVILRVNEARDLGDVNRYQFYDHMKAYTAAPPDVLRVDEKNLREHSIFNCVGVIITTNHKTDGIYLPAEDRRHYVAWSERTPEEFAEGYWKKLWQWYEAGGFSHVAAYLTQLDISTFDPKAPPPKTEAFWAIVDANRAPEEAELADVFDMLGSPDATTLAAVTAKAGAIFNDHDLHRWLNDRRNRRAIPHRLEKCGYIPVRNDTREDGLWVINGSRQTVYAKASLPLRDQLAAARALTSAPAV